MPVATPARAATAATVQLAVAAFGHQLARGVQQPLALGVQAGLDRGGAAVGHGKK